MSTEAEIVAKLDKPGAGVPVLEGLLLRWLVGPLVSRLQANWEADKARFDAISAKLLKEIEGLSEQQLATKILVPKQPALEDSSRYWSAAMVLEHLVIVGEAVRKGIISLSKGVVPERKPDTAKVKPKGDATPHDIVEAYRKFSSTVMAEIDRDIGNKDSKSVYSHPWMGPFNCRQWHWLLPTHQAVHLRQLREIVKGLKSPQ
jgi:hypothetical protein